MWKVFEEVPRFEVSDLGEVRNSKTKKPIKFHLHSNGYLVFATKIGGRKGINKCFKVHRLVASCFLPNPNNYPQVNHIDGDKLNNSVENLEWCTPSHNIKHAYELGLITPTPKTDQQRLTSEQVSYVLSNFKSRCKVNGARALGRKFGVDKSTITKIVRNRGYLS